MPWSPNFDDVRPDPRLDPYRGRAGRLTLDGKTIGHILVETDHLQQKAGGVLWWSRWAPAEEFAIVSVLIGDALTDGLAVTHGELDEALDHWANATHRSGATTYGVSWLDVQESERVHRELFGHHH